MDNLLSKEDVEKTVLLTDEEIKSLNYDELCLYLGLLDKMKDILEGGD